MNPPTATQKSLMENTQDLLTVHFDDSDQVTLQKYPWYVLVHCCWRPSLNILRPTRGIKPVTVNNLQSTMRDHKLCPPWCYCKVPSRIRQTKHGTIPNMLKWREQLQSQPHSHGKGQIPTTPGLLVEFVCGNEGVGEMVPCEFKRESLCLSHATSLIWL